MINQAIQAIQVIVQHPSTWQYSKKNGIKQCNRLPSNERQATNNAIALQSSNTIVYQAENAKQQMTQLSSNHTKQKSKIAQLGILFC